MLSFTQFTQKWHGNLRIAIQFFDKIYIVSQAS